MKNQPSIPALLDHAYEALDGSEVLQEYSERHGIESAAILTVYDDETADLIAGYLAERIESKIVVEIGGGIGLLAFHLAQYAKRVYCIEANPAWSWLFVKCLMEQKPKNVSYLFGAAEEFAGLLHADIALFCTHSDANGLRQIGYRFAPDVIDVYGELVSTDHPMRPFREMGLTELAERLEAAAQRIGVVPNWLHERIKEK